MLVQILIGSALMVLSILISGLGFWLMEILFARFAAWLSRPPHRPKQMLVLIATSLFILVLITLSVWIWALAFWGLGVFITLEASTYFSLVSFTTLGFGDVLLPQEWRLLAGMIAANGLLNIGLFTAILVEVMRQVRLGQSGRR